MTDAVPERKRLGLLLPAWSLRGGYLRYLLLGLVIAAGIAGIVIVIVSQALSVGSSGGLWRVSTDAANCTGTMCSNSGGGSAPYCGNEVWYMDQTGAWQQSQGIAAVKVIAGADNNTAFAITACSEVYFYNASSWVLIAGQPTVSAHSQPAAANGSRRRLRQSQNAAHDDLGALLTGR
ncbi:hypothetical protein N2152v2_011163 [Parachlorella kessleri]